MIPRYRPQSLRCSSPCPAEVEHAPGLERPTEAAGEDDGHLGGVVPGAREEAVGEQQAGVVEHRAVALGHRVEARGEVGELADVELRDPQVSLRTCRRGTPRGARSGRRGRGRTSRRCRGRAAAWRSGSCRSGTPGRSGRTSAACARGCPRAGRSRAGASSGRDGCGRRRGRRRPPSPCASGRPGARPRGRSSGTRRAWPGRRR